MNKISKRSLDNLKNVDPRLCIVIGMILAEAKVDFTITSGFRSVVEQQDLYAQGRTKEGSIVTHKNGTDKKSYHQTGKAIDFIPYPFKGWDDKDSFKKVGKELERVANHLGFKCQYGGDWSSFKDYPHFQLE